MQISDNHSGNQRSWEYTRSGAMAVEAALANSIVLVIIIGMLVGGLGVFRYQEVALMACEGARYASVHGKQYETEVAGATAATAKDIFENAMIQHAHGMDKTKLKYSITWDKSNYPVRVTPTGDYVTNTVTVTVTYEWMPEAFLVGPINLTSTSTVPMSY